MPIEVEMVLELRQLYSMLKTALQRLFPVCLVDMFEVGFMC